MNGALRLFDVLWLDIRYGCRWLGKSPGFTAAAVITLALGIGASTAIFTLVHNLTLQSLPVSNPEQLAHVQQATYPGGRAKLVQLSSAQFAALEGARDLFQSVLAFSSLDRPLIRIGGQIEPPVAVQQISRNYFTALGVTMTVGDGETEHPSVFLSHRFWRTRFGGDPRALGRLLEIDGRPYAIAGVAGREFWGLEFENPVDVWVWSGAPPQSFQVVARLRPNLTADSARAGAMALLDRVSRPTGQWELQIDPAGRGISKLRGAYGRSLWVLMMLVTIALLITCANLGTLLTVRNHARMRELAVRVALGARRSRVVIQLLVENGILAILGGSLALLVSQAAVSAIISTMPQSPPALGLRFHGIVLAYVAGVSLVCTLLFALLPVWRASRYPSVTALKSGPGQTENRETKMAGRLLLAGQIAFSVVLLTGASLFVQTIRNLASVNIGFATENLLQVLVDTRSSGYRQGEVSKLHALLMNKLAAIPGVRSVSSSRNPILRGPLSGWSDVEQVEVGQRFFETMRIPLMRGRYFTAQDHRVGFVGVLLPNGRPLELPGIVVISESLAKQLFADADPIGKQLLEPLYQHPTIVGVVADAKFSGLRNEERPAIYVPQAREPDRFNAIEVRFSGAPSAVAGAIQREIREIHPKLLLGIETMRDEMDRSVARERLVASISALFGGLGLILACVGTFGMAAHGVTQRSHELAIRAALGAGRGTLIQESLRDTLVSCGCGLLAGIVAAAVAARLTSSAISVLLFNVAATDPANVLLAAALMIASATLVCAIPAWRAARLDPMDALRQE